MDSSVIFNIPNIIDYFRIIFLISSIFYKGNSFVILYSISVSLDYFDGMFARSFNQVSLLGGALDMIIDRVSTMVILSKTALENPQYSYWYILYSVIDFISHFLFFLVSAYTGIHHKKFSSNIFMKIYYTEEFLYFVCLGSELCFLMTYIFKKRTKFLKIFLNILQGIAGLKTFFHVVHFVVAIGQLSLIKKN